MNIYVIFVRDDELVKLFKHPYLNIKLTTINMIFGRLFSLKVIVGANKRNKNNKKKFQIF
jgi:hypothetical protein